MRSYYALLFCFSISLSVEPAFALELSWDGGAGTQLWADPANWDPNVAPFTSDDTAKIGDLPGSAGASVVLDGEFPNGRELAIIRRLVLFNGAELDTNGNYLRTLGNTVLRGNDSRLLIRNRESVFNNVPVRQTSFETYNLTLEGSSTAELENATAAVWTQGGTVDSFGVIDIDAEATLQASGNSLVNFFDFLHGLDRVQVNNNGTLRVGPPTGATGAANSTLTFRGFDPNMVVDLDGDSNQGVVELDANATLHLRAQAATLHGELNLSAGSTLKFENETTIGDAVFNVDGGRRPTRIISKPVDVAGRAMFNVKAGTLEFGTRLTTSRLMEVNVAPGAAVKFNRDTVFSGKLNLLGEGSELVVNRQMIVNSTKFDWDGVNDNATVRVNSGGSLIINANRYGDGGFDGRLIVDGGTVQTITNVPWRLLGELNITSTKTSGFFASNGELTIARPGVVNLSNGSGNAASAVLTGIRGLANKGVVQGNGVVGFPRVTNDGTLRALGKNNDDRTLFVGGADRYLDLDGESERGRVEAISADLRIGSKLADSFDGVASVDPGQILDFRQGWILGPGGVLNLNGQDQTSPATLDTTFTFNGPVFLDGISDIRGTVNVTGTANLWGDAIVRSGAKINLTDSSGNLQFGGAAYGETYIEAGVEFLAEGQVRNLPSARMGLAAGVDLGDATLVNDARLEIEGDLFASNFIQRGDSAFLVMYIGGTAPEDYTQILTDFGAQLDGLLGVGFTDDFVAADGDSFSILMTTSPDQGGISGQFDDLVLPELPAGLDWNIDYLDDEVRLSVGQGGAAAIGVTTVPEPSGIALMLVVVTGAGVRRSRLIGK